MKCFLGFYIMFLEYIFNFKNVYQFRKTARIFIFKNTSSEKLNQNLVVRNEINTKRDKYFNLENKNERKINPLKRYFLTFRDFSCK